jgi:hypothetical protein
MRPMHRMQCLRTMRPGSLHPSIAWAVAGMLSACASPLQNGGVILREGVGERFGMLCRWRHGEVSGEGVCAAPEQEAQPVRVERIAGGGAKLKGPLADGRAGDYLIENEEVAFLIRQVTHDLEFAQAGGNIADAADARLRIDELGSVSTHVAAPDRWVFYRSQKSGAGTDGSAWIEVLGNLIDQADLSVTTRYTLRPRDRALLITTTLKMLGTAPATDLILGDAIHWGSTEKVAPGMEAGFNGPSKGGWIAGIGHSVAYAVAPVDDKPISAENEPATSRLIYAGGVRIEPGQAVRYDRVLAVAPRGDTLGVLTELFFLQGGAPGGIEIAFADPQGRPISPPEGRIWLGPGADGTSPFLRILNDAAEKAPHIAVEAPPGRYTLRFEGGGRQSARDVAITVQQGNVSQAQLVLSEPVSETPEH